VAEKVRKGYTVFLHMFK